jgi:hypothetical protein
VAGDRRRLRRRGPGPDALRRRDELARPGIASLRAHQAYIDGLGGDFDPDAFLRTNAVGAGEEVGCEYAVTFRRYAV